MYKYLIASGKELFLGFVITFQKCWQARTLSSYLSRDGGGKARRIARLRFFRHETVNSSAFKPATSRTEIRDADHCATEKLKVYDEHLRIYLDKIS